MRSVTLMSLSVIFAVAGVATAQQARATILPAESPTLVMPDQPPTLAAQQPVTRAGQPVTPRPAGVITPVVPVTVQGSQALQVAQARAEIVPTQNVRVELTITDVGGGSASVPAKKTVTMLIADGLSGRIRSSNFVIVNGSSQGISINVDTTAKVRAEGRIQLSLTFEYTPDPIGPDAGPQPRTGARPASISESLSVLVPDGKSTLISQSADPAGDRRVNIEVTATVVK